MIRLNDFSVGYGRRRLLSHVDTVFRTGCLTALIGRNGSGKSTLLRTIARLNDRYSGDIFVAGNNLKEISPQALAKLLSFVTTERTRIGNFSCRHVVSMGRAPYTNWIGRLTPEDSAIVDKALESVGMAAYAHRTMDRMSDGECQRIMIARALAQSTPAILLDEPTSFLDMPNRYDLAGLLRHLAHENGKCIIFSTHELDLALRMCDSVALVDNGNLYHLPVADMISAGHIERLFSSPDFNIADFR